MPAGKVGLKVKNDNKKIKIYKKVYFQNFAFWFLDFRFERPKGVNVDPIADMFSQIRTARDAGRESLNIQFSKIKLAILDILKNNKKVIDYKKVEDKNSKIEIKLPASPIYFNRISRPGRRVYASNGNIPKPKAYQGFIIVSTSEGLMMGEEARKKGLGGEIIAEVS